MADRNFLNLHVIISHSPSCLNRDDMNMQKSAVFGGARRVRISSQSLKRSMRRSEYYQEHLGTPSDRTRDLHRLSNRYTSALGDRFTPELVTQTVALIAGKEGIEENTQADAVAPWSASEVARLCDIVSAANAEGLDKKKLEKRVADEALAIRAALDQTVDIALSGRMATSGLMSKIDGAMSIAHAITTHTVDADVDWFTAVDDLVVDEGDIGAGHLNTQEFGSGVFYRYASINLRQLRENLGNPPAERIRDVAAHVTHMLATVVPEAKQHSFGAYNLADYVLASFSTIPVSGANAFEAPVERSRNGFLKPSIDAFETYMEKVHKGYGLDERRAAFSLGDAKILPSFSKLADLESWIRSAGEEPNA
jgi:CRISPR system Cascade subunit CasC